MKAKAISPLIYLPYFHLEGGEDMDSCFSWKHSGERKCLIQDLNLIVPTFVTPHNS